MGISCFTQNSPPVFSINFKEKNAHKSLIFKVKTSTNCIYGQFFFFKINGKKLEDYSK